MYASNHFDKKEMTKWENKPEAIKNDFNDAKTYFEGLVQATKSTNKTAVAPPASTTSKVQTKQPRPIAAMNFAST